MQGGIISHISANFWIFSTIAQGVAGHTLFFKKFEYSHTPLVRAPSCAVFEPKILSPDHFQPPFYRLNFAPFSNGFVASIAIIYQYHQFWEQIEAVWYLFYNNVVWQTIILAYFTVYISCSAYIGTPPSCADPLCVRFLGRFSCPPTTAHEGGMTVYLTWIHRYV